MNETQPRNSDAALEHSKERLRLWLRTLRVARLVEAELRERLRTGHTTTLPRFDVLAALHRNEKGLRMSELSNELMVSNGNVTGIIERLVSGGQVMRHAVEGDRRATVVRLTRKGREEFAALAREHEGWVDELLSPLTPADATMIVEHMNKLLTALENKDNHA